MANSENVAAPRRITVALTGCELPPALGAVLRHLAAGSAAEFHAMFIEDSDLLKAVALPFVVEFCNVTSARRPITREHIEAHFRREAAAAQQRFARLAAAAGVHWQFEIVRQTRRAVLSASLAVTDAVVVPPPGDVAAGDDRGSGPVVAIVDATPAGQRALAFARGIAVAEGVALEPYTLAVAEPKQPLPPPVPGTRPIAPDELVAVLRRGNSRLTVLAGSVLGHIDPAVRDLHEASGAPLVIMH